MLRNVGINVAGFIAGKAAAAVTGILLLRALHPEAAGIYGAALGFAALFQGLADLGLNSCLTKQVGAERPQASLWLSRGLLAQGLQTLGAGIALQAFLMAGGAHGIEPGLVSLAFLVVAMNSLGSPVSAVLQGLERFGLYGTLVTTASLLNAFALVMVRWLGHVHPALALRAALASSTLGLLVWWGGAWAAGLRLKKVAWGDLYDLWRAGLPFALVSLTNQLYVRIDQAILVYLVGPGPLGLYVAAVRLVDLMVPALMSLTGPLYSRLAGLHGMAGQGDTAARSQAWGNLNRALRFMGLICLPLGVGGMVLAGDLCRFAFGSDFMGAAPAMAFLAWVPALIGLNACLMHGLNAVGRTMRLAQLFGANLVINIGLNLWLIPSYGIAASAAITALGEAVNLVASWTLARRAGLAPSLKTAFWPSVPAAIGMGAFLAMLGPKIHAAMGFGAGAAPVLVLLGMGVYAALMVALGFLGDDERALYRRLFQP